jgi:hypothetical protein
MDSTDEQLRERAKAAATHLEDVVFNAPGIENHQFEDFMVELAKEFALRYGVVTAETAVEGGENA